MTAPEHDREHDKGLKLLVPTMPSAEELRPWLEKIDRNRQYSNFGPLNRELEQQLAALVRTDHAVTVSSGTLGLELALAALGIDAGSRVLVPSLTFPATAAAIVRAGLTPVFGDVDEQILVMTPAIARRAAARTAIGAVLTVAVHGTVHDPVAWDAFTAETNIPVLIDAAGVVGRQMVGRTTSAVFSLHATKPLAAGEGGFVATQDAAFAARLRSTSNFGFRNGRVTSVGTNAKLSEYHAAVALAALGRWPETLNRWMSLYDMYAFALQRREFGSALRLATAPAAPSNLCVRAAQGISAHHVERLSGSGIETRRWYWPPVHEHPAFAAYQHADDLSATNTVSHELLGVPFHLSLDLDDIERVCTALHATFVDRDGRWARMDATHRRR